MKMGQSLFLPLPHTSQLIIFPMGLLAYSTNERALGDFSRNMITVGGRRGGEQWETTIELLVLC